MVLRTCRYQFHETLNMFEKPEWWEQNLTTDAVEWIKENEHRFVP